MKSLNCINQTQSYALDSSKRVLRVSSEKQPIRSETKFVK